jgi:hypothetical protein
MALLLHEIKERLALLVDVDQLCDLLEITVEDILDEFGDKILDNIERIYEEVDLDDPEMEERDWD